MPASIEDLLYSLFGPGKEDPTKRLSQDVLTQGGQARADRHNQDLPAEIRQSQDNQDWDHYLVGNEMAGPQFPLKERIGAVLPMVAHEVARPFISPDNKGIALSDLIGPTGGNTRIGSGDQITGILNRVTNPSGDQPTWISEGPGAGGAAAEPSVGFGGALRNLLMLYRGATAGKTPGSK